MWYGLFIYYTAINDKITNSIFVLLPSIGETMILVSCAVCTSAEEKPSY